MSPRTASLLMIAAAFFWGTHPTLIRIIDWTPMGVAWVRALFCALLLIAYIMMFSRFSLASLRLQLLSGGFLALNSALFVGASSLTTPANAVVLMFTFPWITLALDYFSYAIKPSTGDILRSTLGVTGILFILFGELSSKVSLGDVFALCAGFAIALHIFFSQKLTRKHGSSAEVLNAILLGWLISLIVFAPFIESAKTLEAPQIRYLLVFGILSALPWLLWSKAVAYIKGHVLAALLGVEVFVAAIGGWWILADEVRMSTLLGGALILIAAMSQIGLRSRAGK